MYNSHLSSPRYHWLDGIGGRPGYNDHGKETIDEKQQNGYLLKILARSSDNGAPLYEEKKENRIEVTRPDGQVYESYSQIFYTTEKRRTRKNKFREIIDYDPDNNIAEVLTGHENEISKVFLSKTSEI